MDIDVSKIKISPTRVYYLKMDQRPESILTEDANVTFRTLTPPIDPDTYLKYYALGFSLHWLDRLVMPKEDLSEKINSPNVHIYVMNAQGKEAGFIELAREEEYVELLYFGLFPTFIGKGLGKYFLDWSIHKAW